MTDIARFLSTIQPNGRGKLLRHETDENGTPFKTVLHLPSFRFSCSLGREVEPYQIPSPTGQMTYAGKRFTTEQPSVSLSFSQQGRPEILELIFGRRFTLETGIDIDVIREFTIPEDGIVPALEAGTYGADVAAEQAVKISLLDENNNTTAGTATVGAGFELTFDTADAGKTGTAIATVSLASGLSMSEKPVGLYDLRLALVIAPENKVAVFSMDNCDPQPVDAFDPAGGEVSVTFMPINTLGACISYDFTYTGKTVAC